MFQLKKAPRALMKNMRKSKLKKEQQAGCPNVLLMFQLKKAPRALMKNMRKSNLKKDQQAACQLNQKYL
ncbi:hypothetical protein EYF80_007103 [Liparis tanakae]|uniref:Uncharacterized protein n=1 Tax=Liparis tanakae TaxID=230148 RepID=A0A4Z2IX89_9TELE|nr:hypothetical protein EYF80_007103 [Liparis tanakae]